MYVSWFAAETGDRMQLAIGLDMLNLAVKCVTSLSGKSDLPYSF